MFCVAPSTCKVIEIISKQALQILNILLYMRAHTKFKNELKKMAVSLWLKSRP